MAHQLHKHAFNLARKLKLANKTAPEDRLQHLMQIVVVFAVLVLFIAWLNTVKVIKGPGTYVGAGVLKIDDTDQYAAYAVKTLDMGLDFMLIDTKNPEIQSLCAQDDIIYGLKCYFAPGGVINGQPLKVCPDAELACNAFQVNKPSDLEVAVMSCTSIPPNTDCILRAFPLWHRTVFTMLAILYFLVVVVSVIFRQESLSNKVLKFWRNVI